MDRGTWQVTVYGVTESDTTERLTLVTSDMEKHLAGAWPQDAAQQMCPIVSLLMPLSSTFGRRVSSGTP